jgi:tetratricopeptide (TPR) repeat protein
MCINDPNQKIGKLHRSAQHTALRRKRKANLPLTRLQVQAVVGAFALANAAASFARSDDELFRTCFNSTIPNHVVESCSEIIKRTILEQEDIAAAFKNRGLAYDDLGQYDLAIQDFHRAIIINPRDWAVYNSRGATRIALRLYAEAVDDFDRALGLNPRAYVAFSNRCFAKALLGDCVAALSDCNKGLLLKVDDPNGLASRGFVKLLLKQYDAAIADYDAALRIRPGDPFSLYGRGASKFKKGDLKGADADVVKAQGLRPDIADYMASIGIHLANF